MKILAIDSSGLVASAALLSDGVLIAEYTVNYKKTHSQTLLPMIDEIVRMTEQSLDELDVIAVAEGPGSFTGLRIGAATVDALAYNCFGTDRVICPIMDARRNQVYAGLYMFEGERFITLREQAVFAVDELVCCVNDLQRPVIFLGDGVPVYQKQIENMVTVSYSLAPAHIARQRAGAVGALAQIYYEQGKFCSAEEHVPVYLRLSQAERERKEVLEK